MMTEHRAESEKASMPRWKLIIPPRSLNAWERAMIDQLMVDPLPYHHRIARQLSTAVVTHEISTDPSVKIEVKRTTKDRIPGVPDAVVYSALSYLQGHDADGMIMWAILKAGDGYVEMLEVQRADGSPFARLPSPENFLPESNDDPPNSETHQA